jgi:hypothetical protein
MSGGVLRRSTGAFGRRHSLVRQLPDAPSLGCSEWPVDRTDGSSRRRVRAAFTPLGWRGRPPVTLDCFYIVRLSQTAEESGRLSEPDQAKTINGGARSSGLLPGAPVTLASSYPVPTVVVARQPPGAMAHPTSPGDLVRGRAGGDHSSVGASALERRFGRRQCLPFPSDPTSLVFMPRRKSSRSQLYREARDLGNIEAAAKGPGASGKRVVRRSVYRRTNRSVARFLALLGL